MYSRTLKHWGGVQWCTPPGAITWMTGASARAIKKCLLASSRRPRSTFWSLPALIFFLSRVVFARWSLAWVCICLCPLQNFTIFYSCTGNLSTSFCEAPPPLPFSCRLDFYTPLLLLDCKGQIFAWVRFHLLTFENLQCSACSIPDLGTSW